LKLYFNRKGKAETCYWVPIGAMGQQANGASILLSLHKNSEGLKTIHKIKNQAKERSGHNQL
jgi:hypothetical protein